MSPGGDALHLTDSAIYVVSDAGRRIIFRAARLVRQVGDSRKYSGENNSSDSFFPYPILLFTSNPQAAAWVFMAHGLNADVTTTGSHTLDHNQIAI